MHGIALTKLDVLDGFDEIKLCIGYDIAGERYDYLPASMAKQAAARPVSETLEGWRESTRGARAWAQLQAAAHTSHRSARERDEAPGALMENSQESADRTIARSPIA